MGIACKIHNDYVEAANGRRSNLFDAAMRYTNDRQKALDIYTVIHTDNYIDEVHKPNIKGYKNTISEFIGQDSLSNIEGAKLREVQVNNFRTFQAEYQGQNIGRIRTYKFQDGYKIESSLVKPEYQGQGVGTALYNDVINKLISEGNVIYSDNSREPAAEKIWTKLLNSGIAETVRTGYQIRPFPNTIDENGEPKLSEVLKYIGARARENKKLSFEQTQDIKNALLSEPNLREKLTNAFLDNGIFVINRNKMQNAGYTRAEVNEIITNLALQNEIKSAVEAYLVSEEVLEPITNTRNSAENSGQGITIEDAIERNNGNSLDKTSRGTESKLFQKILTLPEVNGNRQKAEKYKAQLYSENFKSWFGDWQNDPQNSSKVVDENGEPLLVYHGSPLTDIQEFTPEGSLGRGVYFTENIEYAQNYTKLFDAETGTKKDVGGKIYPAFVNIKNPQKLGGVDNEFGIPTNRNLRAISREQYDKYLEKNNDGVVFLLPSTQEFYEVVAFESDQVKLLFNSGEFNGTSNSVQYQVNGKYSNSSTNLSQQKDTNIITRLGMYKNENPYLVEKGLVNMLGGIADKQLFESVLSDSTFEGVKEEYFNNESFANDLYNEMQGLSRLREFKINGEGSLVRKTNTETQDIFEETYLTDVDNGINEDIVYLYTLPQDIWENNPEEVTTLLESIREKAIDYGIDLSELETYYNSKNKKEIIDLLNSFKNLNLQPIPQRMQEFVKQYEKFYDVNKGGKIQIERVEVQHRNKTLIYLDSPLSEYELFATQGLLKVQDKVYQKVDKIDNVETLYDLLANAVTNNPNVLPIDSQNKSYEAIRADIKTFAQNESAKINLPQFEVNTDELQKMILYKYYFKTDINIEPVSVNESEQLQKFYNFEGEVDYLTQDFIADFNKEYIRNKQNNTQQFNNFYSHFEITGKGITIKNTDPVSMQQIKDYLRSDELNQTIKDNLIQYSIVSKNMNLTDLLENNSEFVKTDEFMRNYYANNPAQVKKAKGQYTVINSTTIASQSNPKFIRIPKGVFEAVAESGNVSFYSLLPQANPNYNQFNIEQPELNIDVNNYSHLQSTPESTIRPRNYYTKRELEQINQNHFNC